MKRNGGGVTMPEAKPTPCLLHSSFTACTLSMQMPMLLCLRLHQNRD